MKVNWDSERCSHSGICVKGLPQVFRIESNEFLIETSAASRTKIIEQVSQCPSGALTIDEN